MDARVIEKDARGPRLRLLVAAGAALAGAVFSLFLVLHAHQKNGSDCFPLDDPWIHLTYARNLHDFHRFAYFPGDTGTQGSTSPLYTMLLALGFSVTRNEKLLSYTLGILFQLLFLFTLAGWARRRLGGLVWAAAAVLLLGLDGNIAILSVSGMETSLFLFLIALAFRARLDGRRRLLGLALGLLAWVRPDGMILAALFALDALWMRWRRRSAPAGPRAGTGRPWTAVIRHPAVIAGTLILAYFAFNLAVGGALLPNTFAAKTAYYRLNSRIGFVRGDLRETFCAGAWLILLPFWVGAALRELARALRNRPWPAAAPSAGAAPAGPLASGELRLEAAWAIGLPLAYLILLPFAHRFDRYLVPALPAVAILGLSGVKDAAGWISTALARKRVPAANPAGRAARGSAQGPGRTKAPSQGTAHDDAPGSRFPWRSPAGAVAGIILAAVFGLEIAALPRTALLYTGYCNYHFKRHERTGRWLADHTPPGAVIAAHDVGAIAYYSGRKVVDMVGVVLPEAVRHLNSPDYTAYLAGLFAREKVTHLAVLRNWCEVANVAPLFVADPQPEILEVYPWIPGRTHLCPQPASDCNNAAYQQLRAGNTAAGIALLERSLSIDRDNSRTWLLLGLAQQNGGRADQAESSYRRALDLFPEFPEARFQLAAFLQAEGRSGEARSVLQVLMETQPDFPGAAELYKTLAGG